MSRLEIHCLLLFTALSTCTAIAGAQDNDLAIDGVVVLAPSGTLIEPTENLRIDIDLDMFAGERLVADGFLILLEPPRPPSDALFGNGFEIQ